MLRPLSGTSGLRLGQPERAKGRILAAPALQLQSSAPIIATEYHHHIKAPCRGRNLKGARTMRPGPAAGPEPGRRMQLGRSLLVDACAGHCMCRPGSESETSLLLR